MKEKAETMTYEHIWLDWRNERVLVEYTKRGYRDYEVQAVVKYMKRPDGQPLPTDLLLSDAQYLEISALLRQELDFMADEQAINDRMDHE